MHICIICNEYPPSNHGGIGSFTKDLAIGLIDKGYKVSVIGIYSKYVLNIEENIEENINGVEIQRYPFKEISKSKKVNYLYNRYILREKIIKLHKKEHIDIIEAPEHGGWIPLGTIKEIPLITRLHSSTTLLNKRFSRLISFFEKWQIKNSDFIISVSKYTAEETLKVFNLKKDYQIIYNSIKIPYRENRKQINKKMILFTGSIVPKKGVTELIRAMNVVFKKFPKVELYLAGKNLYKIDNKNYEDYLRDFISNKFQKNIHFLGSLDREKELIPLLEQAYFCCFPSHIEAFSLAPLEAMALEKAVIYTKYASGKELIEDGVSGLLVDAKNHNDIADKIIKLLEDNRLCQTLAKNGKRRVDKMFSYEQWIKKNIKFYKDILDEK
jgi:glycosyltransferase involved in cell wall biosynthesis